MTDWNQPCPPPAEVWDYQFKDPEKSPRGTPLYDYTKYALLYAVLRGANTPLERAVLYGWFSFGDPEQKAAWWMMKKENVPAPLPLDGRTAFRKLIARKPDPLPYLRQAVANGHVLPKYLLDRYEIMATQNLELTANEWAQICACECAESTIFENKAKPALVGGRYWICLNVHKDVAYCRQAVPVEQWCGDDWTPRQFPVNGYDKRLVLTSAGDRWVISTIHARMTLAKPVATRDMTDLSDEEFSVIWNAAIDWQYLVIQAGGIARKSDLDAWLQKRFNLALVTAHTVSNYVEEKAFYKLQSGDVIWRESDAGRPAPVLADYNNIQVDVAAAPTAAPQKVQQLSLF